MRRAFAVLGACVLLTACGTGAATPGTAPPSPSSAAALKSPQAAALYPEQATTGGSIACPNDTGAYDVLVFHGRGPDRTVEASTSGCGFVSIWVHGRMGKPELWGGWHVDGAVRRARVALTQDSPSMRYDVPLFTSCRVRWSVLWVPSAFT
jgi:hypothetical protein